MLLRVPNSRVELDLLVYPELAISTLIYKDANMQQIKDMGTCLKRSRPQTT